MNNKDVSTAASEHLMESGAQVTSVNPYPGLAEAVHDNRVELSAEKPAGMASTTIGVYLKDSKRLYTYQCNRPVKVGDRVNVKLPRGAIITVNVEEVHPEPQLSDKWETKWAVVVQTLEEYEASLNEGSDLAKELGL